MSATTHLIYFSPTRTTREIIGQVAAGLACGAVAHHDLTRLEEGIDLHLTGGLAIIGTPVYAGRVPEIFLKRIAALSGHGVPAVLVVLYGNRAFEDALVELRDVIAARGFTVLAAAAFVGEHSYATEDCPVAAGRPDANDLQLAREFGIAVAGKLREEPGSAAPEIPGTVPYKERAPLGGIAPETSRESCTLCGTCAGVCPTYVIEVQQEVTTNAQNCIMCCACVKSCPEGARALRHPMVEARRELLVKNCSQRKEPSIFL
jgi:ferredoxin